MTDNRHVLWQKLLENFEKAYHELIMSQCVLTSVGVTLRAKDLTRTGISYEFGESTNDRHLMLERLRECFDTTFRTGILYRTTGVVFSGITSAAPKQLSIFEVVREQSDRSEQLERVLEHINGRYGKRTVNYGVHPAQEYRA